jgi:hypothetical protein
MTHHWLAYAQAQHKNLQVSLGELLQAYELVLGAVGPDWLQREEQKEEAGKTIIAFHPLYRDLHSSTNQAVVAVAELAKYLTAFTADPALAAVVKDLRSEKFPSTFFELAMAYRWKKAGAEIALQPPTPKGIADFEAKIHGLRYVVECSVCPDEFFQGPEFRITDLVGDTIIAANPPVAVAAKLTMREYPPGDWQGELRKAVKKLTHELMQRHQSGGGARLSEDAGPWLLELEAVTEATEKLPGSSEWGYAFRIVEKPKVDGEPSYKLLSDKRERERVRMFLKVPPGTEDPYDTVVQKLLREARQLRGIADARIVLLDISPIASDVLTFVREELANRLRKAVREIPEMPCVLLFSRGWSTALRFQYRASYLQNPESVFQVPESFLQKLIWLEWRWDFITEREIPLLGEEEALREWRRRSNPDPVRPESC